MAAFLKPRLYRSRRISLAELVRWTQMLHALFTAGLPLTVCLQTLLQSGNLRNRMILQLTNALLLAVENGERLSRSMQTTQLPGMFVRMIKIAEETGEFEQCLQLLSTHYQQQLLWQRKLRKLLFYPLAVLLLSFVVMSFVSFFVLPQFQGMYRMMGLEINSTTAFIFFLLHVVFPLLGLAILTVGFVGFRMYLQLMKNPQRFLGTFLKLCRWPYVGNYFRLWFSKLFVEMLSPLLQAGLPVATSLRVLSESAQHILLRPVAAVCNQSILQGYPLSEATSNFPFCNELQAMVQLAEQTGDLAGSLTKTAVFLQQEWRDTVEIMIERAQPLLMMGVGTLVGGTVLVVMLPLFQLLNAV